jgi:hypothetical protein
VKSEVGLRQGIGWKSPLFAHRAEKLACLNIADSMLNLTNQLRNLESAKWLSPRWRRKYLIACLAPPLHVQIVTYSSKSNSPGEGRAVWDKHDWEQFFDMAQRRWQWRFPPWPVAPSGANRVQPVVGFSPSELDDAGINPQVAERLGLPVDAARIGAYSANVSARHDFGRLARCPGA